MIKVILRFAIIFIILIAIYVLFLYIQFDRMNRAGIALKTGNGELALHYLKPFAMLGDTNSQKIMADLYTYGYDGVPKNLEEATYWLRRYSPDLRDGSDPVAAPALEIAKGYFNRESRVEKNQMESCRWLKIAVQGGNKEALQLLKDGSLEPCIDNKKTTSFIKDNSRYISK